MALAHKTLDPSKIGEESSSLDIGLRKRIVGQDSAVECIINTHQMYLTGLNYPGRPVGNFLFLGPTGSGKTRIVEATAESLVGTARAVIKIDCGEFQHSHEISKLVGSPPGYLGHRETKAMLSQKTLDEYHSEANKLSFVLFDEIEKANDALWNLLLGILDKATLTLGNNERTDFSRAMIFMTSNLGSLEMAKVLAHKMGFGGHRDESDASLIEHDVVEKMDTAARRAARQKFTPEFMNRLDHVVVFHPLCTAELQKVLEIEIYRLQQHILDNSKLPFVFRLTDSAKDFILHEGTDTRYGARHLRRALQRLVMNPLARLLASKQIESGDIIRIETATPGPLAFVREDGGLPIQAMLQSANSLSVAA